MITDIDKALRPEKFEDFTGQMQFVKNLQIFINASKKRKEMLDHILLSGAGGLGKTTLSKIIANQFEVEFVQINAGAIEDEVALKSLLISQKKPFILFIDEIHRLIKKEEEILYEAMEDGTIALNTVLNGKKQIKLQPFTLIGATTRAGLLTDSFRDRFHIKHTFEEYTVEEIKKIVIRNVHLLKYSIDENEAEIIAKVCRGVPRIANGIIRRIRDFCDEPVFTELVITNSLSALAIDTEGLNSLDYKYLNYFVEHRNSPTGLKTLALYLNEEPDTIEEVVEPFLIKKGFVNRTNKGRIITEQAYDYLKVDIMQMI